MTITVEQAQKELSKAYADGASGVLISGLVWSAAAFSLHLFDFQTSALVFFFGGMAIYPLSALLDKRINGGTAISQNNPLSKLGLEVTMILFVGLFLAFWLSNRDPAVFYGVMLMIIGARYVPFTTIYGQKLYWGLGGVLMILGMTSFLYLPLSGVMLAGLGGLIEIIFAIILWVKHRAKIA